MRLRNGYLIAGVAWALFLAPAAAYGVLGAVAGVLWIYVFGDNPWPAVLDWMIPVIGLVVFILVAACCIYFAHRYGRQREGEAVEGGREWRRVLLWILAPLALIAITAAGLWQRSIQQAETTAELEQRQAVFTALLNTRHEISELVMHEKQDGDFEADAATSGGRPGPYRLMWQVSRTTYGERLFRDERNLEMGEEEARLTIQIPIEKIAESYRDRILSGGGVLVDEPLTFALALVPELDDVEIQAWPDFERYRWGQGNSPLLSSMTTTFSVRFIVGQDGKIDYLAP